MFIIVTVLKVVQCFRIIIDHFLFLKAQQQRHERDLALLKLKAEQEALECQRQLEETRNKAAQVMQFVTGTPLNLHLYLENHCDNFNYILVKKIQIITFQYFVWNNFIIPLDSCSNPVKHVVKSDFQCKEVVADSYCVHRHINSGVTVYAVKSKLSTTF